ncbi:MAG: nucleotidyltransferase domain-containing protein [Taibaiella sp.]|nr:nucleotidyltransferase domain-containing protein [Taibaiella sp.]
MAFGLRDSDIHSICSIMEGFPVIEKALIFGSRALDTYKPGSDVDIALIGDNIEGILWQVNDLLEQTTMPYFFDVLAYSSIKNADLKIQIDKYGKVIWQRN